MVIKAFLLAAIALLGFWLSNILYDRGYPFVISRKVAHAFGGLAYFLAPFLFASALIPILLSLGFTLLLSLSHFTKPEVWRGFVRPERWAEIAFPLSGTICLIVGWGILGNPWLGVVPILFMAWGDMVTGLVRYKFYSTQFEKGIFGSLAMFGVCALVALLFKPYLIALCGAVIGTIAERYCGERGVAIKLSERKVRGMMLPKRVLPLDNNLTIPLSSLIVMGVLWLTL